MSEITPEQFLCLLADTNTISYNRIIAHAIGNIEAQLYQCLIGKWLYYKKRNMLTEDDFFYATSWDIQESTTLTQKQQKTACDKLVKYGLVRAELKGVPAKKHFRILFNANVLHSIIEKGNKNIDELHQKREQEQLRLQNKRKKSLETPINSQYSQNGCTRTAKTDVQVQTKRMYLYEQNGCTCTNEMDVLVQPKGSVKHNNIKHNNNLNLNNQSINQSISRGSTDGLIDGDSTELNMMSDDKYQDYLIQNGLGDLEELKPFYKFRFNVEQLSEMVQLQDNLKPVALSTV